MPDDAATPPPDGAADTPDALLTPALQELIQILIDSPDLNVDEIAERLIKSPGTVRTQIADIQERLGVRTRAGIVARAWEWNLTEKPSGSPPPPQSEQA